MCFNLSWCPLIPKGLTLMLVLAIFSSVLGMVQFGYNTGVMNIPEDVFRKFLNYSYSAHFGSELSKDGQDLLWATTVSIFAIGGMIGGLQGGALADWCGRKCGLLLNNAIAISAATLLCSSKYFNSFECLVIGRFLIGLNCGLNTTLVPMYISEISPINLRGSLGTISQLGVTLGLLLSEITGLPSVLGTESRWPFLLGVAFLPAVLQLILLPFCPESPRYLMLTKGEETEAKIALQKFRCKKNVEEDLDEMKKEKNSKNKKGMTILQLLQNSSLRTPLIIAIMMHLSQQLSGINAIFYYSTDVFIKAGVDPSSAKSTTTAVGATMVIMTIISVPLMDRAGRRTLHLYGLAGMFLTSIFLTISLLVKFIYESMRYVSVFSSLLFVMFFALGPGSIPWLITAELFSQSPRPAAISVAVLVNWFTNFFVGLIFPLMNRIFESYSFLPFTAFLAIFWTFTYHRVPETKGRTFDEIATLFKLNKNELQLDETDHQSVFEEIISNGLNNSNNSGNIVGGGLINIASNSYGTYAADDIKNSTSLHHSIQPGFNHFHHPFNTPVIVPAQPNLNYQCSNLKANIFNQQNLSHHLIPISFQDTQTIPIAHSSLNPNFFTTTNLIKPLSSKPNSKNKKRSIAEIDGECLLTNNLIQNQL